MEPFFLDLLKYAPPLAAVLWVMKVFLEHTEKVFGKLEKFLEGVEEREAERERSRIELTLKTVEALAKTNLVLARVEERLDDDRDLYCTRTTCNERTVTPINLKS